MFTNKDDINYKQFGINTKSSNFRNWLESGLLDRVDKSFIDELQSYWKSQYGKSIDPSLHLAFMNLTEKKDVRIIPGKIMRREILPVFNDYNVSIFYGDKSLYDIIINPARSPETIIRNIRGKYFDSNYNNINIQAANTLLTNSGIDLIIKPNNSNNGKGISKLKNQKNKIYLENEHITIQDLEKIYKSDFIIQKTIEQHPVMAAPHPASVNTLRMVTFRWKNEIRYLFAFARFGSNNDVRDNASVDDSPRLGITDSGEFYKMGLSQNGRTFTHHPTTGYSFADMDKIPNFEEFKRFVIDCHKNVLHHDFISWDVAVGIDEKPIFIECNFAGTTPFYQLVTQRSIFGDITDEVLDYVVSELKTKEPLLMKKDRKKIEKRKIQQQEKEMIKNKNLIAKLKKENKELKKQLSESKPINTDK